MVLVTVVAITLLIGGIDDNHQHYLADIQKNIKSTVEDKARRKTILNESKALSDDLKSMGKTIKSHLKDLVEVHVDYSSGEAEFDAVTAQLLIDQQAAAQRILDARDLMREQMTKEEWNAVFK